MPQDTRVIDRVIDEITFQTSGTVPIVEVIGELDLGDLRAFEGVLEQALRSGSQDVIVSLARTAYFNSGGIRAILRLAAQLGRENRRLLLVAPRDQTPRRLLDIVYLTSDMLPFESVAEALVAIRDRA